MSLNQKFTSCVLVSTLLGNSGTMCVQKISSWHFQVDSLLGFPSWRHQCEMRSQKLQRTLSSSPALILLFCCWAVSPDCLFQSPNFWELLHPSASSYSTISSVCSLVPGVETVSCSSLSLSYFTFPFYSSRLLTYMLLIFCIKSILFEIAWFFYFLIGSGLGPLHTHTTNSYEWQWILLKTKGEIDTFYYIIYYMTVSHKGYL